MIKTIEISNQKAVSYILREPISRSSTVIAYIPISWQIERLSVEEFTC